MHKTRERRRVAYCEVPKLAGVYTFAVNLAEHLERHGYDLQLVGVGPQAKADYCHGMSVLPATVLAPDTMSHAIQRDAFIQWLREQQIDIVMISGSETEHRLVPTLPSHIRVVSVINNATRGQYRVGTYCHERMHRLVCISPRLRDDIVSGWNVPKSKVELIPYGINTEVCVRDVEATSRSRENEPLRLVYLGRLCDSAKGIFLIPKILAQVERAGVAFHLTVIGNGPDDTEFALRMDLAGLSDRWTHLGSLRYDAVPSQMLNHDVLLFPSRHEGLGLTLLEGMAAGCVPVASRLSRVTDYVIDSPEQGYLFPVGKTSAFAQAIIELARDRRRLARMSAATAERIRSEFTRERMAERYAAMFDAMLAEPPLTYRTFTEASMARTGSPFVSWRRHIPVPVKNVVRTVCERVGITV